MTTRRFCGAPESRSSSTTSRREALERAALGAGAVAAAGLLASLARPASARAQSTDDEALRDFLVPAIALEQLAALAYDTAADATGTDGDSKRVFERFRDQEQAHANALRSALDSLGFDLPDAPDSPTDSDVFEDVEGLEEQRAAALGDLLGELDGLRKEDELLDYLAGLEREQLAYYLEAAPGLDSEDLARTSAEIVGNQAQHLVVLRLALGDDAAAAVAAVTPRSRGASE
jgi:rubrerythrin